MTENQTTNKFSRHLRLQCPSVTLAIYQYIVEHGPVRMSSICKQFPDENPKSIAATVSVLYKRGDVQRTGVDRTYSYTAQPLTHVERLPAPPTWLRQDQSNLASRIYILIEQRGSATEQELREAILQERTYHRKSIAVVLTHMVENAVLAIDPSHRKRPRRYIIGPQAISSWEQRQLPIFGGKKREAIRQDMDQRRDEILTMARRGGSALSIGHRIGVHVRMVHRWFYDQGWMYHATTGRYWSQDEQPHPPSIEELSRDIGGLQLKKIREDAESGRYTVSQLGVRYNQSGHRIQRLLTWWKIPIPYFNKPTNQPVWNDFRKLPFSDALEHLPLPYGIQQRIRGSSVCMDRSMTVDDVRQEIGREGGGRIGDIIGIGPSAIRKLRAFLRVEEPKPSIQNEENSQDED